MIEYIIVIIIAFYFHVNVLHILAGLLKKRKYSNNHTPLVSVIITALNEEKVIERTLKKLSSSSYQNLEIIIMDDSSNNKTAEIAKKYAKVIKGKKPSGKANALNNALKIAKGELIYIIDADSLVQKNTIANLVKAIDDNHQAAHGPQIIYNRKSIAEKSGRIESLSLNIIKFSLHNNLTNTFSGRNFMMTKKSMKKLKGFRNVFLEDVNMSKRFLNAGFKVNFVPNAIIREQTPHTIYSFFKQQERWFKGALDEFIEIYKKGSVYDKLILMPFSITGSFFVNITAIFLLLSLLPLSLIFRIIFISGTVLGLVTVLVGMIRVADKRDMRYFIPIIIFLFFFFLVEIINAFYLVICNKNLKWFKPPRI